MGVCRALVLWGGQDSHSIHTPLPSFPISLSRGLDLQKLAWCGLFRLGGLAGRDIPGVSNGCHPLVTVLRILSPQLQCLLVLMGEVHCEVMLHQEEDRHLWSSGCPRAPHTPCSSAGRGPRYAFCGLPNAFYLVVSSAQSKRLLCDVTKPMLRM